MKVVFFGLGSIGQRHVKNIKTLLPEAQIIAVRSTYKNIDPFVKQYGLKIVRSLKEAFSYSPQVAFITNPTSLHISTAISCAQADLDLFIEKPLYDSLKRAKKLAEVIIQKKRIAMVGFMMHYHPGLIKIRSLLDKKAVGTIMSVQIVNSEYLPDWHPQEDYRKGYSARKDLGGGIISTFSHEIEYINWLFGKPNKIYCLTKKTKQLETEVEDSADIFMITQNKIPVSIHLDHIIRPPVRRMTIFGDLGRIEWNYYYNEITWYTHTNKQCQRYAYEFDRNQMFVSELQDFFSAMKTRKQPLLDLNNGIENMKVLLAAYKAAATQKGVRI